MNSDAVVIVPVKKDSERFPHKNYRDIDNTALWELALNRAYECRLGEVVVLTDDEDIRSALANSTHTVLLEPEELIKERLTKAVSWALENLDTHPKTFVMTLPTSPFATANDLLCAYLMHRVSGRPVMSVSRERKNPFLALEMDENLGLTFYSGMPKLDLREVRTRISAAATPAYRSNGAVYVSNVVEFIRREEWYTEGLVGYEVPPERSIDIDTWEDYQVALAIYRRDYEHSAD
jgi:CMP-N-acetylneuraminic acid synthetase